MAGWHSARGFRGNKALLNGEEILEIGRAHSVFRTDMERDQKLTIVDPMALTLHTLLPWLTFHSNYHPNSDLLAILLLPHPHNHRHTCTHPTHCPTRLIHPVTLSLTPASLDAPIPPNHHAPSTINNNLLGSLPITPTLCIPRLVSRSKITPIPQIYPFSRAGYYALNSPPEPRIPEKPKTWVSVGMTPK